MCFFSSKLLCVENKPFSDGHVIKLSMLPFATVIEKGSGNWEEYVLSVKENSNSFRGKNQGGVAALNYCISAVILFF